VSSVVSIPSLANQKGTQCNYEELWCSNCHVIIAHVISCNNWYHEQCFHSFFFLRPWTLAVLCYPLPWRKIISCWRTRSGFYSGPTCVLKLLSLILPSGLIFLLLQIFFSSSAIQILSTNYIKTPWLGWKTCLSCWVPGAHIELQWQWRNE